MELIHEMWDADIDLHEEARAKKHLPLPVVLNPHIHRPDPVKDPDLRDEYDAGLRILIHLSMILSGVMVATVMTMIGCDVFMMISAQAMIPGAIQEFGDYKWNL